jgi:Do/DeqQ family serine protease
MMLRRARVLALAIGLPLAMGAATAVKRAQPPQPSPAPGGIVRVLPQSAAEARLSFAPIVERTAPAVVNVYSRHVVREQVNPFFNDEFLRMFGGPEGLGLSRERVQESLGSGVIVRGDGIIVTNNHVVAGGDKLTVVLADRREFAAELVLADQQSDLAVLRIHPGPQPLPTISFGDSDQAKVGDLVLAIGDPFGVGQTVTNGIISALARTGLGSGGSFIQTDAPINQGNSGGALVTLDGKLVGINTMIYSPSGGSVGIGFAIPANLVRLVVDQALSKGKIVRPWFGATTQAVTPETAQALGLSRPEGVIVTSVRSDSPAARAGLRQGDLILSMGGFAVDDPDAVRYRIATETVDQVVPLVVSRKGVRSTLNMRLAAPPENPPRDETLLKGEQPLAGATVINLSPAVNEAYNIDLSVEGVMVLKTAPGTPAQGYGLTRGDLVLGVNGQKIETVDALKQALAKSTRRWIIRLERGGQVVDFQVQI